MADERIFIRMLKEICDEKNIKFSIHSFNWVFQLEKDDKIAYIYGNDLDLNGHSVAKITSDKYATYCILNSKNIPACECKMVFNPSVRPDYVLEDGNYKLLYEEFLKHKKVVVKPNDGLEGIDVFLCTSMKEIELAVEKIFKTQASLSICPYYNIKTEYRAFYLNGKVHLIYGKQRPSVIGDGKSNLSTLIEKLDLPKKSVVEDSLKRLDLKYIPKKGEIVYISWKYNLSGGATPFIIEPGEIYDRVEELALNAGKAMNLKFATIDIIKTGDNDFKVLEVNSGASGSLFIKHIPEGYGILKQIYSEAVDLMLK